MKAYRAYVQKDLGYPRTPTDAKFRVEMPNGTRWDVPVQVIVDSRDEHYADEAEDTVKFIRDGGLREYHIRDWAGNNMNWEEVQEYATPSDAPPKPNDWQEGWVNGDKQIVGKI